MFRTDRVEDDVLRGVHIQLLSQVGVDLQELETVAARKASSLIGLRLERREQSLEPLEGTGILANPDELDTAKTGRGVRAVAQMVDVFENGGPGSDTNASTDEHSDFVLEYVFGGSSVGSVDTEIGHLLAILQSNLVHSHGVDTVVKLGLGAAGTNRITESAGEVTNLANVNRDVRVEGAGSDGKWVPLVVGDRRHLEEEPLAGLVLERGLVELELDNVVRVADNTGDLGKAAGTDLTVGTLHEVESTRPQLPTPAKVADAVVPVVLPGEWRVRQSSVANEAAGRVGVQSEEEGDEQVVGVPERLERLLTNAGMGGSVHQEHAEKHDMASDTTSLGVVNLDGGNGTNLRNLDVEEAGVVSVGSFRVRHETYLM